MKRRTAIITDGEQRAALAIVRSLGGVGWRCIVVSRSGHSLAGASRYAEREVPAPEPLQDAVSFGSAVVALAQAESATLVIPVTEASLLAVLPLRGELAPALLPFASEDAFRRICDKALLMRIAANVGIAVPAQLTLAAPADAARLTLDALPFPVVLKPSRSVGEHRGTRQKLAVRHAASAAELARELSLLPPAAFPLLVQQRIQGPGVGLSLLVWGGRVRAMFAHRRLREKPPAGGVSVYRESVPTDPLLLARSRALLQRFDWQGVAMVEYKIDARTGAPYLMEVNGRFWGSLQLAIDAGVDFPRLLAECALGNAPGRPADYRYGVRSRWWWGEVDHVLSRLHRSRRQLHLDGTAPPLAMALLDFLVSPLRPRDREEVFRPRDPAPFFRETRQWLHSS